MSDFESVGDILPRVLGLPDELARERQDDRLLDVLIAAGLDGRMTWSDVHDIWSARCRESWVRDRKSWLIYTELLRRERTA